MNNIETNTLIKILIIEDNEVTSLLLKGGISRILPESEIYTAFNLTEAIEMLKNDYSVITLDGKIPNNEDGIKILEIMSAEQKNKVIVCSTDEKMIEKAKNENIIIASKKPPSPEELERLIFKILNKGD